MKSNLIHSLVNKYVDDSEDSSDSSEKLITKHILSKYNDKKDNPKNKKILLNNQEYADFDWKTYIENYPDLQSITTKKEAFTHWNSYGKKEGRTDESLNNQEYTNFDWKTYIENYPDLRSIITKKEAFTHWNSYGKKEGRTTICLNKKEKDEYKKLKNKEKVVEIIENIDNIDNIQNTEIIKPTVSKKKIIFKKVYDSYGLHYFGWKGVINYFLDNFSMKNKNFLYKIFFDEWIEKLLLWGNKIQSNKYIDKINKKNYKIITFIHNPPVIDWEDQTKRDEIIKNTLTYDNYHFNENTVLLLKENNLLDKVIYIYTLSNNHKQYLYKSYPELQNKLLSVYHPIDDLHNNELSFNYNDFVENKKIFHIGWWLRNFNTFIDLKLPSAFEKVILIKNDFKDEWNTKFLNNEKIYDMTILNEFNNDDYIKLFKNSCMFIHTIDNVANNLVLECIKYNTPIIINRSADTEEYLGIEYPLFYDSIENLDILMNEDLLLESIHKAFHYLENMNKNHVKLDTFNNKLNYDLLKLKNKNRKLTWFCLCNNADNYIENFLSDFVLQTKFSETRLIIVNITNSHQNNDFVTNIISRYINSYSNITCLESTNDNIIDYLNLCIENTKTEYIVNTRVTDIFLENYSEIIIDYFNNNPTCDIGISSFYGSRNYGVNKKLKIYNYEKDTLFFSIDIDSIYFKEDFTFCWRKSIHKYFNVKIDSHFLSSCVSNNLNIISVSENPLYIKLLNKENSNNFGK
jgi:hypothetical protein